MGLPFDPAEPIPAVLAAEVDALQREHLDGVVVEPFSTYAVMARA